MVPLALVDDQIPVVALSPENTLTEKLVSNLEEVKARGGTLYVFGGGNSKINIESGAFVPNARVQRITCSNHLYHSTPNSCLSSGMSKGHRP
jgi:glucosamine 6-phosphate synthetase-like amidotransferase/phosphosugar isomerase protein